MPGCLCRARTERKNQRGYRLQVPSCQLLENRSPGTPAFQGISRSGPKVGPRRSRIRSECVCCRRPIFKSLADGAEGLGFRSCIGHCWRHSVGCHEPRAHSASSFRSATRRAPAARPSAQGTEWLRRIAHGSRVGQALVLKNFRLSQAADGREYPFDCDSFARRHARSAGGLLGFFATGTIRALSARVHN